jgi:hypothetical protein
MEQIVGFDGCKPYLVGNSYVVWLKQCDFSPDSWVTPILLEEVKSPRREKFIEEEKERFIELRKFLSTFTKCQFCQFSKLSSGYICSCEYNEHSPCCPRYWLKGECDQSLCDFRKCDCEEVSSDEIFTKRLSELDNGGDEDAFGICVCGDPRSHPTVRKYIDGISGHCNQIQLDGIHIIVLAHS